MEQPPALAVGLEPASRDTLSAAARAAGLAVEWVESAGQALQRLRAQEVLLVVAAEAPVRRTASDLLPRALRIQPDLVVLVVSPPGETETPRHLLDQGAFDLLDPAAPPELWRLRLEIAIRERAVRRDLERLRESAARRLGFSGLVGRSAAMETVRAKLQALSTEPGPALIFGEAGTGRKLAASILHQQSPRADHPWVVVDVVREGEAEAAARLGFSGEETGPAWRQSAGGTLVVAEAQGLSVPFQQALLAAWQARERVSREDPPRLVLTVEGDPEERLRRGEFLEDWTRLTAGASVRLPALRERRQDIPWLAWHFLDTVTRLNALPRPRVDASFFERLQAHAWPGNVRELREVTEEAVLLAGEGALTEAHLPPRLRGEPAAAPPPDVPGGPFREAKRRVVQAFERRYLRELLARTGGNVTAAAREAGMLRSALQRLLRKYDIRSADFRQKSRRQGPSARP